MKQICPLLLSCILAVPLTACGSGGVTASTECGFPRSAETINHPAGQRLEFPPLASRVTAGVELVWKKFLEVVQEQIEGQTNQ